MTVRFKMTSDLLRIAMANLRRPHPFAMERVGFFLCRPARLSAGQLDIVAAGFHAVADQDYLHDLTAGAAMGSNAIRKALQICYRQAVSMFHIHIHEHAGKPCFSGTDKRETALFVPDFWHVQPTLPHGALVLSEDSAFGMCWVSNRDEPIEIAAVISVGVPIRNL